VTTAPRQLSIDAEPENIRLVRRTVADAAVEAGADTAAVDAIALAVDEAVSNAVRHAYMSGPGYVHVSVEGDDSIFAVVVRDNGRGFTGAEATREEHDGGFGLPLIEALTREYAVVSAPDRGTEVRMVFRLHGSD
jgi:serine/threonine-protein kinase RsbW